MGRYTETINIRVSPELKRALEHAAMKQALNTSTLARSLLFKTFFGDRNIQPAKTGKDFPNAELPTV